jgi:hypothetical protein
MEKYAELWAAMGGDDFRLSFKVYNSGYYDLFHKVYGRPFPEVWNEFRETFLVSGIQENPEPPVFDGFFRDQARLDAVSAGGGKVFAVDNISGKVIAYGGGETRSVLNVDRQAVQALAVSDDGERLLVSAFRPAGSINYVFAANRAVVTEYDIRRGWKTGREWGELYQGRYFRDGVIGIGADRHNTTIVYRPDPADPQKEEILLRGTEELLYSNPVPLDAVRIAFIAAKRGVRELCLYNYETRELYTVVSETEDENGRWKYLRGLGFYEGRLLFSYNHDNRMYKLGMADLRPFLNGEAETFEAVFSERDFSGGVFQPVLAKGEVYYRGAFASQDALMKFPEAGEALSGRRLSLSLRPWNDEDRRLSSLPLTVPAAAAAGAELVSSRYWGLSYLNPLRFWLPYPLIRQDPDSSLGITLNGPAFFSMMMDPTDTNQIFLNAALDVPYLMGDITVQWLNLGLGFPLTFEFSDTLDTDKSRYSGAVRDTIIALRASLSRSLGNNRLNFLVSPEFQVQWTALEPPGHSVWTQGPQSAYTWDYLEPNYVGVLGLGVSNLSRFRWEVFGRGASLTAYGKYAVRQGTPVAEQSLPRLEGVFQAAFEPYLPLRFRLYGAWDERGMNLAGQSASFSIAAFSGFASKEYVNTGRLRMTHLTWLAGGEAEAKLFKVEIQRDLSHLYFNRLFGTLAYRGAVYDDQGHPAAEGTVLAGSYRLAQSLVLRLGTEVSFAILPYIPFRLSAAFVGIVKLSDTKKSGNKLWFGPEITLSY